MNDVKLEDTNPSIICPNCNIQIEKNYCSECGQSHTTKRLTATSLASDFLDTFFALKKSYFLNFKHLLFHPQFVVGNYWNGYRNFYFSPNRMLIISTLFLGIFLYFSKNSFIGVQFEINRFPWLGVQFFIAGLCLFFFIISTLIIYFKKRKNLFEHVVLNMYIFSLSIPIFLALSIPFEYIFFGNYLQLAFIIFNSLWIARVFEKTWKRILLMTLLNVVIFISLTLGSILLLQKIQTVSLA